MKGDIATFKPGEGHRWGTHSGLYFSQFGEDCLLWHFFKGKWDGFYVDVGCHHPYRYSNTYLLHRFRNWRGINIDADAKAIALLREARPRDINLNYGVDLHSGTRTFTVFDDGAVNSFDDEFAARQSAHYRVAARVEIPVLPLAAILEQHLAVGTKIDLLDIDCEGCDDAVIASNDWTRFPAKIVLVEIHGMSLENPMKAPSVQRLKAAGYTLRAHYFATSVFELLQ